MANMRRSVGFGHPSIAIPLALERPSPTRTRLDLYASRYCSETMTSSSRLMDELIPVSQNTSEKFANATMHDVDEAMEMLYTTIPVTDSDKGEEAQLWWLKNRELLVSQISIFL